MLFKNKLSYSYWLRKFYTTRFFQIMPISKSLIKKLVFNSIYASNHWVQSDDSLPKQNISVSGHGSNIGTEQFKNLEKNFNNFINEHEIKSILDMPCGDFLWINEIIKNKDIEYLGIDIVDDLIEKNKKKYVNNKINFETHDIVNFKTSKFFDLIIIRDLFIHLDHDDIKKIFENLNKINFKYIALNSYKNIINEDVLIGRHRKINLLERPFSLKKPFFSFKDYEVDKHIFFYKKENMW